MLVGVDAKALEWRVLLELSQDAIGIAEVLNTEDAHSLNQMAFGLPSRLIAKIYLFRTIYRGSGYSFANDPDFAHVSSSADYWDGVNEKFYAKYQGINDCHFRWKDCCEQGQPIVSPLGRAWDIPILNSYGKLNWTQFTNYPVQGTGADVMTIARVSLSNRLRKKSWGHQIKLIQTVHDSIMADCPEHLVQEMVNLYHQVFKDIPLNIKKLFNYEWTVPLDCETYGGMDQKNVKELLPNY